MENIRMLVAAIVAIMGVERPLSHFKILLFGFILLTSMLANLLFMIPEPPAYRMYEVDYYSKQSYVLALADLLTYYEYHDSPAKIDKVPRFLGEMDVYDVVCSMVTPEMDIGQMERLMFVATRINENGCVSTNK